MGRDGPRPRRRVRSGRRVDGCRNVHRHGRDAHRATARESSGDSRRRGRVLGPRLAGARVARERAPRRHVDARDRIGREHDRVRRSRDGARRRHAGPGRGGAYPRGVQQLGVSSERVSFEIGFSHDVLPRLPQRALDVVLLDGAHGFPYPVLDWWHVAAQVRVGGCILLDDAYMPPVAVVVDHAQERRRPGTSSARSATARWSFASSPTSCRRSTGKASGSAGA